MLHRYCKVTIILRKRKNVKETIIVRRMEYFIKKIKYFDFRCIYYTYFHKNVSFKGLKKCLKHSLTFNVLRNEIYL